MVKKSPFLLLAVFILVLLAVCSPVFAQQVGSIRGVIYDKDFDAPLGGANVTIAETGETVAASEEGNYFFPSVEAGKYTLVFAKEGYARQVKADVVVSQGQMTEVDAWLTGDFTEMEEFVVQDVQIGTGTEEALLELRIESPSLLDSISSELMSQAGAGDAAAALNFVSGTTVQEGKFAVVRGLPDRYVNSQMNWVRLPTADPDKRAVQLDQFPSGVIESIQVSKTFTPDQQGDASGGAVNIILKGIPDQDITKISFGSGFNTQVRNTDEFLTYSGGGVNYLGDRDSFVPKLETYDSQFDATSGDVAGTHTTGDIPRDYSYSASVGRRLQLNRDFTLGIFGNYYYKRDNSYFSEGIDDRYFVRDPLNNPGEMDPWTNPRNPVLGSDFDTSLFDVTEATQEVQWGGLVSAGLETDYHELNLTYMFTRVAEDTAILSEDTRGKEYFYPGYDPDDPADPGNQNRADAPYYRFQTLRYRERTTQTLQFSGRHTFDVFAFGWEDIFMFLPPEVDWMYAVSSSELREPDKRLFGSKWLGPREVIPGFIIPSEYQSTTSVAGLGNFQRIWKEVREDSDQYFFNIKVPFEQYTGTEGYAKFGVFNDKVGRLYNQDTFSNDNIGLVQPKGMTFNQYWSDIFKDTVDDQTIDVDYEGFQEIQAWYYMLDVPVLPFFHIIGGERIEKTYLSIENSPDLDPTTGEPAAQWVRPGTSALIKFNPEETNVEFGQTDVLPQIGFLLTPWEGLSFRGNYAETLARQTFKELSPILQQEYLGADLFVGNPDLKMSQVKNYDLRLDYNFFDSSLLSVSWFRKEILDPIEYVQGVAVASGYTYPINFPEGELEGWEAEIRLGLGQFWEKLEGLTFGSNATFINSDVVVPDDERAELEGIGIQEYTREMTNAPNYLYNLYLIYDIAETGTQISVFYSVRGDTLVAGSARDGASYIPSLYETAYGTVNLALKQRLGDTWNLSLAAKNLSNPWIETVYRSDYINGDVTRNAYKKGIELSISLSATF